MRRRTVSQRGILHARRRENNMWSSRKPSRTALTVLRDPFDRTSLSSPRPTARIAPCAAHAREGQLAVTASQVSGSTHTH